jgi:hypothetical protein
MNRFECSSNQAPLHWKVAVVLALAIILLSPRCGYAQENEAKSLVRAMADYLTSMHTISITFDSDVEVVTSELEKLQFTSTGELRLRRPDKLRAHRRGSNADVDFAFDGTTFIAYDGKKNTFARLSAPRSFDQLVDRLRTDFLIEAPGADLFLANVYEALTEGVIDAKHVGQGIIDGIECEHLAFRNLETDWQLWIETGPHPVPRKYVITSKTVASAPQYTLRIRDWRSDLPADDAIFAFDPPAGAKEVAPGALLDIDEIPVGLVQAGGR